MNVTLIPFYFFLLIFVILDGMKSAQILSCVFLSITAFFSLAQNENSKWYFGNKAALDFMNEPPNSINNSVMVCGEGSSSVADESGNLLFYSDGSSVWNKQHVLMANGSGLNGNQSSSQSSLIVKKPGSLNIYYIFTLAAAAGPGGLCYSEIDMSLAAGMGSVTVKNILLHTPTCEKITGVKHCNGSDTWIISHDYNSDSFRANLVSTAGVNTTAVISSVGSIYNGATWSGVMKASSSGKKIAITHSSGPNMSTLELYDFNNVSGIVSNSLSLGPFPIVTYDCEFSPDGSKLYGNYAMFQWDLCAGSNSAIIATVDTLILDPSPIANAQLAINGKIYLSIIGSQNLAVINNPNNPVNSCNYVNPGQSISPNNCYKGLPNFIAGNLKTPFTFTTGYSCNSVSFTSSYLPSAAVCTNVADPINSIEWIFGEPSSGAANTSSLLSPLHQYSAPGTYKVKLAVQSGFCVADTIVQFVTLSPPPPLSLSGNYTICPGNSSTLTVSGANSYTWSTGIVSNSISLSPSVTTVYSVTGSFSNTSCTSLKTFTVVRSKCVGISEEGELENKIKIFPNPFSEEFSIDTKIPISVLIYDKMGILYEEISIPEGVHTINTSRFQNGIYLLKLSSGKQKFQTKMIKFN